MLKNNGKHIHNIVCIGGGTGTFVVLKGLVSHDCNLSAIVSMSDSGGSNKRIRDEFGLLPTSDIRQCLVALSDEQAGEGLLRKLFMYRFEKGNGICGMTFANLFMAALTDILGSQEEAIRQTGKVLRIHGNVIPVSLTKTNLVATYENGSVLTEEHVIDEPPHDGRLKITHLTLDPPALPNPGAVKAILNADCVVLGPGDLYTSVIPNLLVSGIPESIKKTKAACIYIVNLMTKSGQTLDYSASDHLHALEAYIENRINVVVENCTPLPHEALKIYAKRSEYPVKDDLRTDSYFRVVKADVAGDEMVRKSKSDSLVRSLIRHDSGKLANVLLSIINENL